jgi:hypothetical protein
MLATLLAAAACSNTDPASEALATDIPAQPRGTTAEQPLEVAAPESPELSTRQACQGFMRRLRTCGETFIPALVEARVKIASPPEVAALDAKIGRAALVKQAFEEWAHDSRDTAIDATCDHIAEAVLANGRDGELRSGVDACMANAACEGFVPCAVPLNLTRWKELP